MVPGWPRCPNEEVGVEPLLLDLFCGAGGCSAGYRRAGFLVVGVDLAPQPHYPYPFLQRDAVEVLGSLAAGETIRAGGVSFGLRDVSVIHASPPCQRYARGTKRWVRSALHPDLLGTVRELLRQAGRPWVIENVDGAPLGCAAMLCGVMFGLKVFRHRWFESSQFLLTPSHPRHDGSTGSHRGTAYHGGRGGYVTVAGRTCSPVLAGQAMDIGWMTGRELAQAIPPAYTEYIGRQLLAALG
ncbi:MAG: DNA cytosine methyltransferase [Patescibacteria group bacterium]|nr:DNA cytosine methyltransferase [Patescibacteria group bacterium]